MNSNYGFNVLYDSYREKCGALLELISAINASMSADWDMHRLSLAYRWRVITLIFVPRGERQIEAQWTAKKKRRDALSAYASLVSDLRNSIFMNWHSPDKSPDYRPHCDTINNTLLDDILRENYVASAIGVSQMSDLKQDLVSLRSTGRYDDVEEKATLVYRILCLAQYLRN